MTRVRVLQDPASGKTWGTHCDGAVVKIRAGAPGKEKESEKLQADAKAAEAYALKEEAARLRKGFVLLNPAATVGEPRMHRLVSRSYTGALIVADIDGRLLCNAFDPDAEHDRLLFIGRDAQQTEHIDLPKHRLAWKVEPMPTLGRILVRADHQILSWSLSERRFEELSKGNRHPVSFLSAARTRAAWYDEPDVVVADLASGKELLRRRVDAELVRGHSLQMEGALAPAGSTLALCSRRGEIALLDLAAGQVAATLAYDFASVDKLALAKGAGERDLTMVDKLVFTPDGRYLLAREDAAKLRLLCFDVSTSAPRSVQLIWGKDLGACVDLAIEPSGRRLAIAHRGKIEIFDLATMTPGLSFAIEHMVAKCALGWVGRDLGVRTDLGCASLYAVE